MAKDGFFFRARGKWKLTVQASREIHGASVAGDLFDSQLITKKL